MKICLLSSFMLNIIKIRLKGNLLLTRSQQLRVLNIIFVIVSYSINRWKLKGSHIGEDGFQRIVKSKCGGFSSTCRHT